MKRASVLLFGIAAAAVSAPVVLDRVAVTVGNQVITATEIEEDIRVTAFLNNEQVDLGAANRRKAAERLVDQELIRREMNMAKYPQPETSEAQKILDQLKKQRFHSDAEYVRLLHQFGITNDQVVRHLLWQLAALRFTDFRFQPGIPRPNPATAQHLEKKSEQRASARSGVPAKPTPQTDGESELSVPRNIDQELEAWLKEARATTRIEFRKEAFQ